MSDVLMASVAPSLDRAAPIPLHDQVAAAIRRAIAEGEAGPGDRLPLATDLAAVLGVNKNTVLRALRLLRDEGLLEFGRGRAVTVAGTADQSEVLQQARDLLLFARHRGYSKAELLRLMAALP